MAGDEPQRAKRRCARSSRNNASVPSAVHYVGYVEEDETPEMIMAKFAELERIQQAMKEAKKPDEVPEGDDAAPADAAPAEEDGPKEQALTDEQLLEVFKQTSMFSVKTALQDNEMLMCIDDLLGATNDRYGADEVISDDEYINSFWSDDEQYSDDDEEGKGRRRRGGSGRGGGARLPRNAACVRARHNTVTAYNPATNALVRRRVRIYGRDDIIQVQVPSPLPLSWGRTVAPYVPAEHRGVKKPAAAQPKKQPGNAAENNAENQGSNGADPPAAGYLELGSLLSLEPKQLPTIAIAGNYQAILINPGWEGDSAVEDPIKAVARLAKLPIPKLVPTGFVFVWTPKECVQALFKQMTKWGYMYIENLTWVWKGANNKILTLESPVVGRSHMTLYMFRAAGKGKDIELRHQRNPDVAFDFLLKADCMPMGIPEETFVAIETLLPTGPGKYLELWAPKGVQRPGWTHVVDISASED